MLGLELSLFSKPIRHMSDLYMSGWEMPKMTRSGTRPMSSMGMSHVVAFRDTLGHTRRRKRYDGEAREVNVVNFIFEKPYLCRTVFVSEGSTSFCERNFSRKKTMAQSLDIVSLPALPERFSSWLGS